MAYLELKNVTFRYPNGYTAVEDINLAFDKGEKAAIIGQNGAGKTTTVKLMNGLLKPSAGEVLVDGESTKKNTTATIAKKVGYVFQNPDDQIFNQTVASEISYMPKYYKWPQTEIEKSVREVARFLKIEEFLDKNPFEIPYVTRKFVTIAAILVTKPDFIILDEPTAGQDLRGIRILSELLDYLEERQIGVITITHDMEFVVKEFKRVIVMAEKRKRRDSNPRDIFWDYDLLKLSNLKQPYICQLADKLGYENILTIEDLLEGKES